MIQVRATLRMMGTRFSPSAAERRAGVNLAARCEPGELVRTGRYAGQAAPYGSGDLVARCDTGRLAEVDDAFFAAAARLVAIAHDVGIDEMVLHLDVEHDEQCNIELSAAFLAAVQRLGVSLTLSCFKGERGAEGGRNRDQPLRADPLDRSR